MKRLWFPVFLLAFGLLVLATAPADAATKYWVQRGDTLTSVAKKFGLTPGLVASANGLPAGAWLKTGQVLLIPDKHTVRAGETLFLIGKKYGVSAWDIMKANNLKSTTIRVNQKLIIPVTGSSQATVSRSAPSSGSNLYNQNNIYLLAKLIHSESRGEPYVGQVAVGAVVVNRVKSSLFPNTFWGVIHQPGAFTALDDGQFYLEPDQTAYKAARAALSGWDPTGGALYYWNPATSTSKWIWSKKIIYRVGKHVFGI